METTHRLRIRTLTALVATVMVVAFMVTVLYQSTSAASQGVIIDLFPPGNDGSGHGVGHIDDGQGKPHTIFRTPQDVNQSSVPLSVGDAVIFDTQKGQKATNVTKDDGGGDDGSGDR
ncbi:MAG: hypothetical protein BZY88_02705 [SAR202 cluster bacterium Io17-Chloro-G9]|nr:MAG: hypothetical protein BZY88_02705 [SAR202 cluster bacterium Io17-Chloro-G9]